MFPFRKNCPFCFDRILHCFSNKLEILLRSKIIFWCKLKLYAEKSVSFSVYLFVYSEFVQIGTAHFSLDRVISGLQEANESPLWIGLTVTLRHLPTVKRDVFSELVQSNSGLASKQLQHNFFQRHLIVGWLFNNILKIRQNRFGERWEKLEIKIFNFHHRKPNFRKINSDKTSDNYVFFSSRIFDATSLMYFG